MRGPILSGSITSVMVNKVKEVDMANDEEVRKVLEDARMTLETALERLGSASAEAASSERVGGGEALAASTNNGCTVRNSGCS